MDPQIRSIWGDRGQRPLELESTPVFDKDMKKLDRHGRMVLQELVLKIKENPGLGKPLEHYANVFSKRTEHKRLVYQLREGKILLVLYKNRDEAYEALKELKGYLEIRKPSLP